MIFTVEEHNIIGGLGSAVAEHQSSLKNSVRLVRIGLQDNYSSGGSYEYLQKKHGLSTDNIVETILKNYQNNG